MRWDEYLPQALQILRTRQNRATGCTPAKVLYGLEIAKPGQWQVPNFANQRQEPERQIRVIRARQLDFIQKTYPNQNRISNPTFQVGDLILVREYNPEHPVVSIWVGPYPIAVKHSEVVYEIDKNGRQFRYHLDQLRPAPAGNP
ncbi:hypothetical protein NQ315_008746 [Exocentrus adspersus]|uniref:Uncharacterized protein n=1 Tax=Exocentrus adspersus TaxID=1586481 RepID=A0AAV8VHJ7_9CUCU|nr:hypothetical protein NQ315_008746 [Exocentrus adspersus]